MDKNEIKKYLTILVDTAGKIKELISYLEIISNEDINTSIIPFFSNEIKKNIEYLNQYIYDIRICIFTIDDINILEPINNIGITDFDLYPTLLDVKLHDKEWSKYSVLCSNIQEIRFLIIKQYNKLKDSNSKHEQIISSQKEEAKETTSFRSIIQYKDPDKLLNRLHQLIDGRSGADVGCILLKAKQENYIIKNPTRKQFLSEFKLIGTWQAITNYLSDNNQNALDRANRIVIFE